MIIHNPANIPEPSWFDGSWRFCFSEELQQRIPSDAMQVEIGGKRWEESPNAGLVKPHPMFWVPYTFRTRDPAPTDVPFELTAATDPIAIIAKM